MKRRAATHPIDPVNLITLTDQPVGRSRGAPLQRSRACQGLWPLLEDVLAGILAQVDSAQLYTYNVVMIRFEWDAGKARANLAKHGIDFDEAKSVFYDDYAKQFFAVEHSCHEDRFIMLGLSSRLRILVVCHCERADGGVIRIISARRATGKEQQHYQRPAP